MLLQLVKWCDLNLAYLSAEHIHCIIILEILLSLWLNHVCIEYLHNWSLRDRSKLLSASTKELSFTLKFLCIDLSSHVLLVVWTAEEDWVLEAKWTLLCNEAVEILSS